MATADTTTRLHDAGDELATELPNHGVEADIQISEERSALRVRFNGGLVPFARGVVGQTADRHGLTVEWEDETATLTPE